MTGTTNLELKERNVARAFVLIHKLLDGLGIEWIEGTFGRGFVVEFSKTPA